MQGGRDRAAGGRRPTGARREEGGREGGGRREVREDNRPGEGGGVLCLGEWPMVSQPCCWSLGDPGTQQPSLPSQPALARLSRAAQASTPHSGLPCLASPALSSLSEPCHRRPAPPRAAAQPAASRHTGLSFSLRHISSVLEVPGAE